MADPVSGGDPASPSVAHPEAAARARASGTDLYYDLAVSICSTCFRRVAGKIVFRDDKVWMDKHCPRHGRERVLLADDVDYYRRSREVFLKPGEEPLRRNTPVRWGCPYDCGLCPDHEQHSCLAIVEITDHCNLACPICYAASGPHRPGYRPLAEVEAMLNAVVANEGEPDVVQISGGEPTLHPDFFDILDAAKARPIRHLMVNTNGLRIAREPEFAARLADYMPRFEIYLQFDALDRDTLSRLRGADLSDIRRQAVARLNELGVSTTLVVTVARGVNDHLLGETLDWASKQPAVRGVTFQPIQDAGRADGHDAAERITLTEVRRRLTEQSDLFAPADILPVPCHPDCIAMAYALKGEDGQLTPLSGLVDAETLLAGGRNTIVFEDDPELHRRLFSILSTGHSPESGASCLSDLLCCLPKVDTGLSLGYENVFRVILMRFLDAHDFDVRSVKKSCVHFVHPDGRLIPFDTYNLFYRDGLEESRLAPLRAEVGGHVV